MLLSVMLLLIFAIYLRKRDCQCSALPACHTWSCDTPLAFRLDDDWPSWPPAASIDDQLPRDNLPDVSAEVRWRTLHRKQVATASAASSATRVVFLGDSITEGWLRSGFSGRVPSVAQPECEALFRDFFGAWNPLNLAIGGDRVQDLGWRLQHGLLRPALSPSVFFIMMGTNDLGAGEEWHVVADELQLVIAQLHAARPTATIMVHAILPRGGDSCGPPSQMSSSSGGGAPTTRRRGCDRMPWWDGDRNRYFDAVNRINAKLTALAKSNSDYLVYVDCSHTLLERAYTPTDQLATPAAQASRHGEEGKGGVSNGAGSGSYLPPHLMYDLLHLTPAGYRKWGTCIRSHLGRVLHEGRSQGARTSSQIPTPPKQQRRTLASAPSRAQPACVGRTCRDHEIDLARRKRRLFLKSTSRSQDLRSDKHDPRRDPPWSERPFYRIGVEEDAMAP